MPFCRKCNYEYLDESTKCSDCGSELFATLEDTDKFEDLNITWMKLKKFSGIVYAEMAKNILNDNEIPCVLQAGNISWINSFGTSVFGEGPYLLIPENRQEECMDLLSDIIDE